MLTLGIPRVSGLASHLGFRGLRLVLIGSIFDILQPVAPALMLKQKRIRIARRPHGGMLFSNPLDLTSTFFSPV